MLNSIEFLEFIPLQIVIIHFNHSEKKILETFGLIQETYQSTSNDDYVLGFSSSKHGRRKMLVFFDGL